MSLATLLPVSAISNVLASTALVSPAGKSPSPSASVASSGANSNTASPSPVAPVDSSSLQAVTQDLVALLKDLSSGNVSQSKADLARLQADLKSQESASVSASAAAATPPFNAVLNKVAESLAAANTGKALEDLASYLIQAGQASGNIVDEHA